MFVLGAIATELNRIGVPYEFMEWTNPVQYPYFVGEYSEVPPTTEDGSKEATVMLTGTTNTNAGGSWLELEQFRSDIEELFHPVYGLRITVEDGAVAIFYENGFPVPTGEADLKRIQINLRIKKWKGMN
jgi:hypothetical protein